MMGKPMDREAILADIRRVARLLDKDWVSRAEFQRHGTVGVNRVMHSFGTWNNAVMAAGLTPLEPGGSAAHRARGVLGAEGIVSEIRRVARLLDKETVSTGEFRKHARFSQQCVRRVFGTWSAAVSAAGLTPLAKATRIPEQELEVEFMRVYGDLGKVPTIYEFDVHSEVRRMAASRRALPASGGTPADSPTRSPPCGRRSGRLEAPAQTATGLSRDRPGQTAIRRAD
jgi:hypothetical protein